MCRTHHAAPPIQQQHLEHDDLARQARCEQNVAAVAHARLQPALKLSFQQPRGPSWRAATQESTQHP